MNSIDAVYYDKAGNEAYKAVNRPDKSINTNEMAENKQEATKINKTASDYGAVIGKPKLSEKAAKYYEQLKKKYNNMDFILVSEDQKQSAEANAAQYANAGRMVVLIDTDKIEKMASDEAYRKKYEGIISSSITQLDELKTKLSTGNSNVKTYGIQVNDGGNTSFFAVIDKSLELQKERIQEKAEKNRTEKKENAKKAQEKRLEKRKDETVIKASSADELLQKIKDYNLELLSDNVLTDEEKKIGNTIDFKG